MQGVKVELDEWRDPGREFSRQLSEALASAWAKTEPGELTDMERLALCWAAGIPVRAETREGRLCVCTVARCGIFHDGVQWRVRALWPAPDRRAKDWPGRVV